MLPEELLSMLKDEKQMDDEAIKKLLSDSLASLEGPAEKPAGAPEQNDEEAEKAEASKYLGVAL